MKNPDLSFKILLQKCFTEIMETLVLEKKYKFVVHIFGAAYPAPSKGTTISYSFRPLINSAKSYRKY